MNLMLLFCMKSLLNIMLVFMVSKHDSTITILYFLTKIKCIVHNLIFELEIVK